jgi:hypothetical protein
MGLVEKDRMEVQLKSAARHLAEGRAHLEGGRHPEALASIAEARKALAGPLGASLERLDGASVVAMLGRERARAYAEAAGLESDVRTASGDEATANKARARAAEIERNAR